MRPDQRIVTNLPLDELWDASGPILAERSRDLTYAQIRELLKMGPIRFVVADVGHKLDWIAESRCFTYWREAVAAHVADPSRRVNLDEFPGESCFIASEWPLGGSNPIILLERFH
jgi:hypothetical protein